MIDEINKYLEGVKVLCDTFDSASMEKIINAVRQAYDNDRKIFIAGNGGSAGTANHFSCDFSKNAVKKSDKKPKVYTLSSNVEYITALGNDISFDKIFKNQLENLMDDGDLVILISASGNSPDIIEAAEFALSKNGKVIGLTGFSGGRLKELSDISLNIPVSSYEQTEDFHMIITHILVCCFKKFNL